jgi:hypothetical protein
MVSTFNAAKDASYNSFEVYLTNKLERYADERNINVKSVYKDSLLAFISERQLDNLDESDVFTTVKSVKDAKEKKLLQEVNPVLQADTIFLQKYSYVFDKWAHFQITYAFYELDNLLKKNKDILINSYNKHIVFPNAMVFDYNYTQDETNLSNPIELFGIYKPYLLFIVVLFFHFLILLPYFLTDAGGTYPPGGGKSDNSGGGTKI